MIPGAFLLCGNPRCSGVNWEARWLQESDVPRTTSFPHGELTLVTQVTDLRKKNHLKTRKATYIHFYKISGNFRASYKIYRGEKKQENK